MLVEPWADRQDVVELQPDLALPERERRVEIAYREPDIEARLDQIHYSAGFLKR